MVRAPLRGLDADAGQEPHADAASSSSPTPAAAASTADPGRRPAGVAAVPAPRARPGSGSGSSTPALAPHGRLTGGSSPTTTRCSGRSRRRRPAAVVGGPRDVHRRGHPAAGADGRARRPHRAAPRGRARRRTPDADEEWTMPLWDFAARLADYQDAGVAVINLSVGVSTADGRAPLVLDRAARAAHADHGDRRGGRQPRLAARHGRAARRRPGCRRPARRCSRPRWTTCWRSARSTARWPPTSTRAARAARAPRPGSTCSRPGVNTVSTYLGDGGPRRSSCATSPAAPGARRVRRLGVVVGHLVRRG